MMIVAIALQFMYMRLLKGVLCRVDATNIYIISKVSSRQEGASCLWLYGWRWEGGMFSRRQGLTDHINLFFKSIGSAWCNMLKWRIKAHIWTKDLHATSSTLKSFLSLEEPIDCQDLYIFPNLMNSPTAYHSLKSHEQSYYALCVFTFYITFQEFEAKNLAVRPEFDTFGSTAAEVARRHAAKEIGERYRLLAHPTLSCLYLCEWLFGMYGIGNYSLVLVSGQGLRLWFVWGLRLSCFYVYFLLWQALSDSRPTDWWDHYSCKRINRFTIHESFVWIMTSVLLLLVSGLLSRFLQGFLLFPAKSWLWVHLVLQCQLGQF